MMEATTVDNEQRAREIRARRAAERQGYKLVKGRTRDPRARKFGKWWIDDPSDPGLTIEPDGMTFEQVEAWLRGER